MASPDVVGLLLAAGTSERFGDRNKLLQKLDGIPVVRRSAIVLAESSVDDIIAVLGYDGALVAGLVATVDLSTVHNTHYQEGQGTTVARAAQAAQEVQANAAVFYLADMPCVDPRTVDELVDAYHETDAGIVAPYTDGRRGNPVIFDERHFDALQTLSGDVGGRVLFEEHAVEQVEVDDPAIHLDIDTVEDFEELQARC